MSSATITLPTGPGVEATALPLANVTQVLFDVQHKVLQVFYNGGASIAYFDYAEAATVTATISGENTAFVVSS